MYNVIIRTYCYFIEIMSANESVSLQMPAVNVFDSYSMLGAGGPNNVGQGGVLSGSPNPPMLLPQMSASCPNAMQEERGMMRGEPLPCVVVLCARPAISVLSPPYGHEGGGEGAAEEEQPQHE